MCSRSPRGSCIPVGLQEVLDTLAMIALSNQPIDYYECFADRLERDLFQRTLLEMQTEQYKPAAGDFAFQTMNNKSQFHSKVVNRSLTIEHQGDWDTTVVSGNNSLQLSIAATDESRYSTPINSLVLTPCTTVQTPSSDETLVDPVPDYLLADDFVIAFSNKDEDSESLDYVSAVETLESTRTRDSSSVIVDVDDQTSDPSCEISDILDQEQLHSTASPNDTLQDLSDVFDSIAECLTSVTGGIGTGSGDVLGGASTAGTPLDGSMFALADPSKPGGETADIQFPAIETNDDSCDEELTGDAADLLHRDGLWLIQTACPPSTRLFDYVARTDHSSDSPSEDNDKSGSWDAGDIEQFPDGLSSFLDDVGCDFGNRC